MKLALSVAITFVSTVFVAAQSKTDVQLAPGTTLPIVFSHGVDSNHAHNGDVVAAKTTQPVHLADGRTIPAGAQVLGHVIASEAFVYDKTPYAKQTQGVLSIRFEELHAKGADVPLQVYVRALADPVTAEAATLPNAYDDSLRTRRQIGGDEVTPSQSEVLSSSGDTIGYLKHGGVYAHLIAASGNSPEGCDGSDTEQAMGLFSASVCGLYGFTDISLAGTGRRDASSTLTLASRRYSPRIWANSVALLEVVSSPQAIASR